MSRAVTRKIAPKKKTAKRKRKKAAPRTRKLEAGVVVDAVADVVAEPRRPEGEPGVAVVRMTDAMRHHAFADEYLANNYNATDAYLAVYGQQIERTVAAQAGSRLLRNVNIIRRIEELRAEQADRLHLRQDAPIRALVNVMEANPSDVFDAVGRLKFIHDIPEGTQRAIASIAVKRFISRRNRDNDYEIVEYKFWPKVKAAEALARMLGLPADMPQKQPVIERQSVFIFGKKIHF